MGSVKLWLLLAVVAGLLLLSFRPQPGAVPPGQPPSLINPLFPIGSQVRLRANPLIVGYVSGIVWDPVRGWLYTILWQSGGTTMGLAEVFLEAWIGPQLAS